MKALSRFHQRGAAIIAALLIALAATVAAAAVIQRQGLLVDTLVGERDRAQAEWILRGGLDWARIILRNDGVRSPTTRLDGVWAQPIVGLNVSAFDDGREALFSGRIEDEQGKYNLRHLVSKGKIVPEEVEALGRLFTSLDIPAGLAGSVAQRLLDAEPIEDEPARAPGLRRLADLAGLPGMTAEQLRILRPYLTVLPGVTAVNVNTASAEVLGTALPSLPLAAARELITERDRGLWFTSGADFFNRLGTSAGATTGRVAVRSDWFLVSGEVAVNEAVVGVQALLQRRAGQQPVVRWMVGG